MKDLGGVCYIRGLFIRNQMNTTLHPLGKITKTHGYDGTVVFVSNRTLNDDVEHLEEVFVLIDGLPVPFPVEKLVLMTDSSALLQLEFIGDQKEASELAGCELFSEVDCCEQEQQAGFEQWTGYTVNDSRHGTIGVIQNMEDYKGNVVMQVMNSDRETLISLYPELVTRIDHHAKILYITAPDGYF